MNRSQWNAFVVKNSPSALFQSWEWGEVEKKLGHKVWRLTWPEGVAQVVKVPARRGTFLHVRHGPVGKVRFADIVALAKKERAWFVRVSPRGKFWVIGLVDAPIHAMDAEVCWVLDLDATEEHILSAMRKSTRYEIKHASGVTVEKSNDIDRFLRLYDATSARQGFTQHRGIREEFETLDCALYIASKGGVDLAAALVVYFGGEAIYHHGASVPNKSGASYLLQWEAIRDAKKRGVGLYNFWGIAPSDSHNHPWAGLSAFKKGFGGREVRFAHAKDYPVSPFYIIPKSIETIRRAIKGY